MAKSGRPRKFTDEEFIRYVKEKGTTQTSISIYFDISLPTVSYHMKRLGLKSSDTHKENIRNRQALDILDMWHADIYIKDLAKHFSVSRKTVRVLLIRAINYIWSDKDIPEKYFVFRKFPKPDALWDLKIYQHCIKWGNPSTGNMGITSKELSMRLDVPQLYVKTIMDNIKEHYLNTKNTKNKVGRRARN